MTSTTPMIPQNNKKTRVHNYLNINSKTLVNQMGGS